MKTKLILLSFIALLFSFALEFKVDASTNLTVEQKQKLLNLGFDEEEILYLNEEELRENLKLDGELAAKDTRYFRVVESTGGNLKNSFSKAHTSYNSSNNLNNVIEQEINASTYWKEVNAALEKQESLTINEPSGQMTTMSNVNPGVTPTSYKTLTTTISTITAKQKYRVKTSVKWHIMPSNRKKDVIGTSVNSSFWVPNAGTQNGKLIWTKNYNCNEPKTTHSVDYPSSKSTLWEKGFSGYALTVDLPDNVTTSYACTVERVEAITAFSYFEVEKLATTSRIDAYGKLLHQETIIAITPNVSFKPLTFGVSVNQEDKFSSTTTHATFRF